jgi:hypothetical protein
VLAHCGNTPVMVAWQVGQGRVIAITGTALGDAPKGSILFNNTPAWVALMAETLTLQPESPVAQ